MGIGVYGILIIFALFILLLAINPKLSCFGKRIKSPFYPLIRRKKIRVGKIDSGKAEGGKPKSEAERKAQNYGFKLD